MSYLASHGMLHETATMTLNAFFQEGEERLLKVMPKREAKNSLLILLRERLNYGSSDLVIHKGEELEAEDRDWLEKALERLEKDEPLQYIIGQEEFFGLRLKCDRRALIPRPETEEMAEKAVEDMEQPPHRILDLGTGNGCLALALKKSFPKAEVHAVDLSQEALDLAKENMEATGLPLHLHCNDMGLKTPLGSFTFDLMVSNPPYVLPEEQAELADNVKMHEPRMALFASGNDGLDAYREILHAFHHYGADGGKLWVELHPEKAEAIGNLFEEKGYPNVRLLKDLSGKTRFATVEKHHQ